MSPPHNLLNLRKSNKEIVMTCQIKESCRFKDAQAAKF